MNNSISGSRAGGASRGERLLGESSDLMNGTVMAEAAKKLTAAQRRLDDPGITEDPGKFQRAKAEFDQAVRNYSAIEQVMKTLHEIMMRSIANLRLN